MSGGLTLDLLGVTARIDAPEPWRGFLARLWQPFVVEPSPGAVQLRIGIGIEGDMHCLELGDTMLRSTDAWLLANELRATLAAEVLRRCDAAVDLHAAALRRDGVGLLLVGPSGAGKTTAAASLAAEGWILFGDDFAPVTADGRVLAFPKPLGIKAARAWTHAPENWRRLPWPPPPEGMFLVPATEIGRVAEAGAALAATHVVVLVPGSETGAEPLSPARAAMRCVEHCGTLGPATLAAMVRMVERTACWTLGYADHDEVLPFLRGLFGT